MSPDTDHLAPGTSPKPGETVCIFGNSKKIILWTSLIISVFLEHTLWKFCPACVTSWSCRSWTENYLRAAFSTLLCSNYFSIKHSLQRHSLMRQTENKYIVTMTIIPCCRSIIWLNECKGRVASPKRMNFRKSSKRPLTPPSFLENHVAIFPKSPV